MKMGCKTKRGECLDMAEPYDDFYIWGHQLTDEEIWGAIAKHNRDHEGEFFADGYIPLLKQTYEIRVKREEWDRWGVCTCGDDHSRDLYDAQPHARGAFPITYVALVPKRSEKNQGAGARGVVITE